MFGIFQYGVPIYDAASLFTGATASPLFTRATLSGQGGIVYVCSGQATLSTRTTFSSGGVSLQVYTGTTTLSRHPTFFALSGITSNYYGQSAISRHPTFTASGHSFIPGYHGTSTLQSTHAVIGPTSINGLFGWWQFAASGGNAGYDSTNLMHTATLVGSAASGGGTLTLDGTSGYATVSDDPFDTSLTSFAMVVKATASALDGYYRNILSKRSNSSYRGWSLFVDPTNNKIALEASDTGNIPFFRVSTVAAIAANVEYHLAAVFNRSTNQMLLYLNGALQGSVSISGLTSMNNTVLLAFGSEDGQSRWLGTLRDIRFYKRALSPAEVATLASGQNLFGDVPVFGTFSVPVYNGTTTVSRRPTFTSTFGRSGSLFFGDSTISSHPQFAASGVRRVPVFSGWSAWTTATRAVLDSVDGTFTVPVYIGNGDHLVFSIVFSGGDYRIPVYTGDTANNVSVLFHALGVDRYRFFVYDKVSFIVTKRKQAEKV